MLAKCETPVITFNTQAKRIEVLGVEQVLDQKTIYNPHGIFVLPLENPVRQYAPAHIAAGALLFPSQEAQVVFMMPPGWQLHSQIGPRYSQGAQRGYFASRMYRVDSGGEVLGAALRFMAVAATNKIAHTSADRVAAAKQALANR
jgi:hypothetical protein